ncbi:hypothetical protein NC652_035193 [Populus alba x Populus x berolinensis]|nr:hypothetical protein NC652_035193 [Populus alba x Populus x berolinensis]
MAKRKREDRLMSGWRNIVHDLMWRNFSEDKRIFITYFDCLWKKVPDMDQEESKFFQRVIGGLLIFCHLGESLQSKLRTLALLLLDSLEKAGPRCLGTDIRTKAGLKIRRFISKIPLLVPKVTIIRPSLSASSISEDVPLNLNFLAGATTKSCEEECGYYGLYYINLFVRGAPENFCMDGLPLLYETKTGSVLDCLEAFFEKTGTN